MLKPTRSIYAAVLLVAGCGSPPHRNVAGVSGWEDSRVPQTSHVSEGPLLAAPPLDTPQPSLAAGISGGRTNQKVAAPAAGSDSTAADNLVKRGGWLALSAWARSAGSATLTRLAAASSPGFALRSAQGAFILHAGSSVAQWDGLEVRLGFAPQLIEEQLWVHSIDLEKTIIPLISGPGFSMFSGPIVIDPGHGGDDSGTISVVNGYKEKDLSLDWALRLKPLLEEKGLQVVLTRSDSANVAIPDRVARAVAAKASLFVSLHFNSAGANVGESGIETYCLTPHGQPSTITRNYADDPSQTFTNNAFDALNLQLAAGIHRAIIQETGANDRAVRRARFLSVLRGQQCPAVLVEGGYLSNQDEARKILQGEYRQRLAEAVAKALESWVTSQ